MSMRNVSATSPVVLVIAGTDSSGGAGLVRDIATMTALNVEVACAVTAVTAQTDQRVSAVLCLSPEMVQQQIHDAFATRHIAAVKIGMLGNAAIVQAVALALQQHDDVPVILDPVLLSSSGGVLLDAAGVDALMSQLLPRVTLLTPNLPELHYLTAGYAAQTSLEQRARYLIKQGVQAVLVKGGHAEPHADEVVDMLVTVQTCIPMAASRLPVQRRGTGCTLASAIAASLARGSDLIAACQQGRQVVLAYLQGAE